MKKCSAAWLCEPQYEGIVVVDPDGWDRRNFKESWAEEITEDEFKSRLLVSTLHCTMPITNGEVDRG